MPQPYDYNNRGRHSREYEPDYDFGRGYYVPQQPQPPKKRGHGCLTAFLAAIAVVLAVVGVLLVVHPALPGGGIFGQLASLLPGTAFEEITVSQVEHDALDDRLAGCYVYSRLNEADKEKYRIMLDAFEAREQREYPSSDTEDLAHIRNCIIADHPELFYVSGVNVHTVTTHLGIGDKTTVLVDGIYRYDADETARLQQQLEECAAVCLAGIPADADDYEKVKYLYEYLAENVEYDWEAYSEATDSSQTGIGQTAVDALVDRSAVCAGYSHAFSYLAKKLGMQCVYVTGAARGDAHAWNAVELDGAFYYVDVTWGDPQFLQDDGDVADVDRVNYDYLCVTTDEIMLDHMLDDDVIVPVCAATADNYYVREGSLLDSADVARAGEIVRQAAVEGRSDVQMRCTSYEVYIELMNRLFVQAEIYPYLPGDMCWYTSNDALLSITVIF